jgi:phage gpG-like protein
MTYVQMNDDGFEALIRDRAAVLVERLCTDVEADAKAICPVDTGDLKRSISHEVHGVTGRVGSNLDYAAAVEMGFHGIEHVREYVRRDGATVRAHERHANMPAQPYLRPALYRRRSA